MNTEFYLVERKGHIAYVWLNRPAKKNAMGKAAWSELPKIFGELSEDHAVRAVILAGHGSDFCSGIDLVEMMGELSELQNPDQSGHTKWKILPKIHVLQAAITAVERCRKPVIAAIHGYCLGAGLDLATACDIRLAADSAVFSVKEAAVGFVADVGVLQRLPLIVGQGIARELAYTARLINAGRALQIGLVSEVHPDHQSLLAAAETLAAEIAANSPLAVEASKQVMNDAIIADIDAGLRHVASISANIIPSADLREAVTAFQEKRKPQFKGLQQ